jgi:hypothetical protein
MLDITTYEDTAQNRAGFVVRSESREEVEFALGKLRDILSARTADNSAEVRGPLSEKDGTFIGAVRGSAIFVKKDFDKIVQLFRRDLNGASA